jgi:RpiB/LacA/LacB family sugar-phosphate isomerase
LEEDLSKRVERVVEGAFGSEGGSVRFESSRRPEERLVGANSPSRRVAVGSDHRGYVLKRSLIEYLRELGHLVVDCGIKEGQTGDYPEIARRVSEKVVRKDCDFGIVIDAVGVGSAIAANKISGIRAAVCQDVETARSSRVHNDANVLSLGAGFVNRGLARRMVRIWLDTAFEGGRHVKRLDMISKLEQEGLDAGL